MKNIIYIIILILIACFFFTSCGIRIPFYEKLHYIEKSTIPKIKESNDSTLALYHAYVSEYLIDKELAMKTAPYHYVGILKIVDTTIYFEYLDKSFPENLYPIRSFSFSTNQIKNTILDKENKRNGMYCLIINMKDEFFYFLYIDNEKFYSKIMKETD